MEVITDYFDVERILSNTARAKLSASTKALLLLDREIFWRWFHVEGQVTGKTLLFEETVEPERRKQEYAALGWELGAPAQQVAWERSLSAAAATAVLADCGATPSDACGMSGPEFAAKFGESWFELLPRVNG